MLILFTGKSPRFTFTYFTLTLSYLLLSCSLANPICFLFFISKPLEGLFLTLIWSFLQPDFRKASTCSPECHVWLSFLSFCQKLCSLSNSWHFKVTYFRFCILTIIFQLQTSLWQVYKWLVLLHFSLSALLLIDLFITSACYYRKTKIYPGNCSDIS